MAKVTNSQARVENFLQQLEKDDTLLKSKTSYSNLV